MIHSTNRSGRRGIRPAARPLALIFGLLLAGGGAFAHELVNYKTEVEPIFMANCQGLGCHIGEAASGVNLTTHASVMASHGVLYDAPPVIAGRSGASPLYLKLIGNPPERGVRMPPGTILDLAEIAAIRRWIDEGARPAPPAVLRGDTDGNELVEITDAIYLLDHLFLGGPGARCRPVSDANSDGEVDIADPVAILGFLFLGNVELGPISHEERDACLGNAPELSFESLQEKVFSKGCTSFSCHGSIQAKGDLVLETLDASHTGLVGALPFNDAARAAGLLRVDPGNPDNSFLLKKLIQPGPGEGNRMPLSAAALAPDRIAAIREWILAGAPKEGTIRGVPDISDTPPPPPEPIQPPAPPEFGVQIHLEPFQIAAGREREIFKLHDPKFTEDVMVTQIDVYMTEQSHHFILYTWDDTNSLPPPGLREVNAPSGVGSGQHSFITGAQQSFFSLKLPEGVGIPFKKGTLFDLNSHYLNLDGDQVLWGEVYVNIYFIDPAQVARTAKPIFANNLFLYIPPGETRTSSAYWPSSSGVARATTVYSLSSHMHRHGDRFTVFRFKRGVAGEEKIYDNFDWDDPEYKVFDPPLELAPGEGFRYQCVHTNHDKSSPITFGLTSEDEMCITLGYYSD